MSALVGVGVWVWLGGTHIAAGSDGSGFGRGGLGTLLGPEETPCGASWCDHLRLVWSNADVSVRGGCVWGSGCGCVLSVA